MPYDEKVIARIVHKAHSFEEAQEWDIRQNIRMTPEERRKIAKELKRRVFGEKCPDIRDSVKK